MSLDPGRCRSCKARMLWAITEKGKKIPLDVDPEDPNRPLTVGNGNLVVCKHGEEGELDTVRYVPAGPGRLRSHFASCPNRDRHRKVTKKAAR